VYDALFPFLCEVLPSLLVPILTRTVDILFTVAGTRVRNVPIDATITCRWCSEPPSSQLHRRKLHRMIPGPKQLRVLETVACICRGAGVLGYAPH
jgi:hypothetical protein